MGANLHRLATLYRGRKDLILSLASRARGRFATLDRSLTARRAA
jgi:hypothetical protein